MTMDDIIIALGILAAHIILLKWVWDRWQLKKQEEREAEALRVPRTGAGASLFIGGKKTDSVYVKDVDRQEVMGDPYVYSTFKPGTFKHHVEFIEERSRNRRRAPDDDLALGFAIASMSRDANSSFASSDVNSPPASDTDYSGGGGSFSGGGASESYSDSSPSCDTSSSPSSDSGSCGGSD